MRRFMAPIHRLAFGLALLLFLPAPPALAAPGAKTDPAAKTGKPAPEQQTPIQIEADHMESFQADNAVVFTGRVVARQEDVLIHADKMTVYYSQGPEGADKAVSADKAREIQRILSEGNVEITQKDWVATGSAAEYFADERKVIITGNAKVWQNNNMVTGDRFVMFLDEGKTIVDRKDREGERVRAFFYPDKESSAGEKKKGAP